MIDRIQSSGRTRPFTFAEVLRVIARIVTRPGRRLITPDISYVNATRGVVILAATLALPANVTIADIHEWAAAMAEVERISLTRCATEHVCVTVTGLLPGGPRVEVYGFVRDLPVEVPAYTVQTISVDELAALTVEAIPSALAGAL